MRLMPLFDNVQLRNPIAIQAVTNWSYSGQVISGATATGIAPPESSARGTFHLGSEGAYHLVASRRSPLLGSTRYLTYSTAFTRTNWTSADVTTFHRVSSVQNLDSRLWVTATAANGVPLIMALPPGQSIPPGPSSVFWTDRSPNYPGYGASNAGHLLLQKASTEGAYYSIYVNSVTSQGGVMRASDGATAYTIGFTDISAASRFTGVNTLTGYGVSVDGQVQMMSHGSGTLRSTNGGVSWANTMNFGVSVSGHCEFLHVPKWGAASWVMCCDDQASPGKGVWWTSDNGSSWTRPSLLNSVDVSTTLYFNVVEKLDARGEILVGFQGISPLKIYVSLNGGRKWAFVTSILPPYYDTEKNPEAISTPQGQPIVINDNNRFTVIWPGDTGDEGVFVSDAFGPFNLVNKNPGIWDV